MHQRRGLQRVAGLFLAHALAGELAQLFVHGGEKLLRGPGVTATGNPSGLIRVGNRNGMVLRNLTRPHPTAGGPPVKRGVGIFSDGGHAEPDFSLFARGPGSLMAYSQLGACNHAIRPGAESMKVLAGLFVFLGFAIMVIGGMVCERSSDYWGGFDAAQYSAGRTTALAGVILLACAVVLEQ